MKKWYQLKGPESEVALSACVRLSRNLRGIPFPAGLGNSEKREITEKICEAVFNENSSVSNTFQLIDLEQISDDEAIALAERGLVNAGFIDDRSGRSVLVSKDESLCIMMNGEDHFLIQSRTAGLSLTDAYNTADWLDTILDKTLHFAFDQRLGYLTRNPAILGTGMVASINLHLPALSDTGAAVRIASNLQPLGMSLRGVGNSAVRPRGAVFRLSNRMTLGLSEQEAITNLSGIAGQIIAQERAARNKLIQDITVQDTVGRSLGILQSARLLGYDEFLDLISVVRFGVAVGFVKDIRYETIDDLVMRVQPANVTLETGRRLTADERRAARANIVRDTFAGKQNGGA